jgi:hypothetical protein
LDPTLYKGANELDTQKLFLGCGSKLLDFLHQKLYDHFLVKELVPPRHPGSKNCGGSKFLKPEVFASEGLILGIKPFCPLTRVVFGCLEIEVRDVRAHLAAKATSLIAQRVSNSENPVPKRPMRLDPQKTLIERDKTRKVQNRIAIQIMKLNPICEEKATKKRVWGKRQSSEHEGKKNYPKAWRRPRDDFWTGDKRLRRIVLENADLLGVRELLVPNLGLDLVADDGGVGVHGLGPLSGGAGGGAGCSRASLAQQELYGNGDERERCRWSRARGRR